MANMDTHFHDDHGTTRPPTLRGRKWSGRRSIGVAVLASGALWTLIFFVVKAVSG
jgi:hypothetical protein